MTKTRFRVHMQVNEFSSSFILGREKKTAKAVNDKLCCVGVIPLKPKVSNS